MAIAVGRGLSRPAEPHGGLDAAELLLRWRSAELGVVHGKFRRLSREDLEDVYDDTADVLRQRPHESELHLLRALRLGVRLRALRLIRDRNTRERVVNEVTPQVYAEAQDRAWSVQPEQALLAQEDEVIVGEFIAELTTEEQHVFALVANGLSWRAIATTLDIPETTARNLTRACERKRELFVTLYETGRLCGHRSQIIDCLLSGEQRTEIAVRRAVAHLGHCRECQTQHKMTGAELRARFDQGALALLPPPLFLAHHMSLLDRITAVLQKPMRLLERFSTGNGTVRERAAESVAGGAVAAKTAITVGVIALTGAAIEVHHIITPAHPAHHTSSPAASQTSRQLPTTTTLTDSDTNPFQWSHTDPSNHRESGLGHLVGGGEGPGHIVSNRSTGPGRLVGSATGPGRLVTDTQPVRTSARTSSLQSDRPPIKPVGQSTVTTASAGTPGKVTPTPSPSPPRLGRVLGP